MAKPRKRKDGRWVVDVELPPSPDGKRRRKSLYGDTRQEVVRRQFAFMQSAEEDSALNGRDVTVAQYLAKWLEINCAQLSPTTVEGYRNKINSNIIPDLGGFKMGEVTQMDIQEFINRYAEKHRSKSSKLMKGILHKAFNDALENKIVKYNPCSNIKIKRSDDFEYYIYDEDEFNLLLGCVQGTKEEIPIVLAALCGMRAGEIMGLTWDNIDFAAKKITISKSAVTLTGGIVVKGPKTYSSNREFVAPDYAIETLAKYRKDSGFVYGKSDGTAESGKNYGKRFQTLLRQNGLNPTRLHDLRHFTATMLLKQGVSDKESSEMLGHTQIDMTKKYQHILKSMENRAAKALDGIVRVGGQNGGQNNG